MSPSPQFSIITVCRNEAGTIRHTCESIIEQTQKDYEWIVVDGASTDETLSVLKNYEHSITNLISEPDQGIYDAMNKGIQLATGEYLIFMNGGDTFTSPQALQWVAEAPQVDLIYGDLRYDTEGGEIQHYPDQLDAHSLLNTMIPHQASFYRRQLFDAHGLYDTSYRIAGDYELNARLLAKHQVSHFHINKPIAIFGGSGISSSREHRQLRKMENHRVRMKYFRRYRWSLKALRQSIRELFAK